MLVRRLAGLAVASAVACGCAGAGRSASTTSTGPAATTTTTIGTAPPAQTSASPSTTATTTPATTAPTAPTTTVDTPAAPTDPQDLADLLTAAERAVRDPATPAADLEHQAHVQQIAYRALGLHPEWDATVLAAIPADLASAVQLNVAARREFRSMATRIADTVPAWRIVAPAAQSDLLAWYHEAEAATGVGWHYLAAVNLVESGLGRIVGLSTAGAQGPMQFLPSTWAAYGGGGDIDDPHAAILAAARLLAHNGLPAGNVDGALYSYNNDSRYVRGVQDYAQVLAADPAAFNGYYHWQVYYLTTLGSVVLPVGYESPAPVPVADYLAAHPQPTS